MGSSDDRIARLLRLKRYEQPPPGYFEDFLHEFRRRRDKSLPGAFWSSCVERVRDFVFWHNLRAWTCYSAGVVTAIACVVVLALTLYQRRDSTQLAAHTSPVPTTAPIMLTGLNFALPVFDPTLEMRPTILPGSRHVRVLPRHSLRSEEFVPLNLERDLLDDESLPER
jgi:hypothetical protein